MRFLRAGCEDLLALEGIVVQADQCVTVMRRDVRVERDSSRLFNSDESEVRAVMRGDFVVPNPSAADPPFFPRSAPSIQSFTG